MHRGTVAPKPYTLVQWKRPAPGEGMPWAKVRTGEFDRVVSRRHYTKYGALVVAAQDWVLAHPSHRVSVIERSGNEASLRLHRARDLGALRMPVR